MEVFLCTGRVYLLLVSFSLRICLLIRGTFSHLNSAAKFLSLDVANKVVYIESAAESPS